MSSDLEQIKKLVLPVLKEAGVVRSSIFGSFVRSENTAESDVDILVEFPKDKSLFDFIALQLDLEEVLGRKVDLGEYSTIKPRLKDYILNNQVQIL